MEDDFGFDEFEEDFDEGKKEKEEEIKTTDGETTEISGEDEIPKKRKVPHVDIYEVDDLIESSDEFSETSLVSEYLDENNTKLLECICMEARIVEGNPEFAASAFVRITKNHKIDAEGRWIRTSSATFRKQIEDLIEKKLFPVRIRLSVKLSQAGKTYYVING